MSREGFSFEKLLDLTAENAEVGSGVQLLFGAAVPGGDTGDQDDAPIGSLYARTNGELYTKIADTNAVSDWELKAGTSISNLNWRPETFRAATNDTVVAGVVDPTAWTDNESGLDGNDFTVGEWLVGDYDGTPTLFEVTVVTGATSITVAAGSPALAANDTFVVRAFLPDSPAAQENQALLHAPTATSLIKLADVDWDFATGINISSGYAAVNGTISSADTVESAIEKLDGNQQDIQTASGIAQGAVDYGTFTGTTIPDNSDNKEALQALETAYEETDQNVDDLITLSGMPENSTDLGTFTGDCIADNTTVKGALQDLETCIEDLSATGTSTGITTLTTVDTVLVDDSDQCEWEVVVFEEATPSNKKFFRINGFHNGTASADATQVKDTVTDKINFGSFNLVRSIDLDGAGGAQTMRLRISSSTAGVTVKWRRTCVL